MKRLVAVSFLALVVGCGMFRKEPAPQMAEPPPAPLPDPIFVHKVEWKGQTLGEIARWYTGKYGNWQLLTKPVNPELERCCSVLQIGREVNIPRHLVVRTDPMPKPAVVTRPAKPLKKAEPEKPGEAAEVAEEEPPPPALSLGEAPSEAPAPKPMAEAPAHTSTSSTARPSGGASGTVTMKGQSWKVVDAIAYPADKKVEVALSSEPFDRKEIAKDGKVDSFDTMGLSMKTDARTLTLVVEDDDKVNCMNFSIPGGGGSVCGVIPEGGFKLDKRSEDSIRGSLQYSREDEKVDVKFDQSILRAVKRAGQPLPAGGGEPGKAVLARFAANRSGDFEKIKAVSDPEQRKEMDAAPPDERKMALEFMKMSTPSDVKITGGTVDGDSAVLDFVGKDDSGGKVKGTAEVTRTDGKWYCGSISTGP